MYGHAPLRPHQQRHITRGAPHRQPVTKTNPRPPRQPPANSPGKLHRSPCPGTLIATNEHTTQTQPAQQHTACGMPCALPSSHTAQERLSTTHAAVRCMTLGNRLRRHICGVSRLRRPNHPGEHTGDRTGDHTVHSTGYRGAATPRHQGAGNASVWRTPSSRYCTARLSIASTCAPLGNTSPTANALGACGGSNSTACERRESSA